MITAKDKLKKAKVEKIEKKECISEPYKASMRKPANTPSQKKGKTTMTTARNGI